MPASDFVTTTSTEIHERIAHAHARFAALLTGLPDDLPTGGWTVRQTAAHLVNVVNRYNDFVPDRLAATPRGVDEINRRELEALSDQPMVALLAQLEVEMTRFRERWGPPIDLPLDLELPFHGGGTIDLQSALTNVIGELLVHGGDVARAGAAPWRIDARDAVLLCGLATQLMPQYIARSNHLTLTIGWHIDGVAPWCLEIAGSSGQSRRLHDGELTDLSFEGPAEPSAMLLYSRIDIAIAELAGLRASGGHGLDPTIVTTLFEQP